MSQIQYLKSGDVSILMNNGNGTFASYVNYPLTNTTYSFTPADMDGDGDADIVTGNLLTVSVLLNNGNGTFAPHIDYPAGRYAFSVFASDLDGDGDLDVTATNVNDDTITLLRNNGAGGLVSYQVDEFAGRSE